MKKFLMAGFLVFAVLSVAVALTVALTAKAQVVNPSIGDVCDPNGSCYSSNGLLCYNFGGTGYRWESATIQPQCSASQNACVSATYPTSCGFEGNASKCYPEANGFKFLSEAPSPTVCASSTGGGNPGGGSTAAKELFTRVGAIEGFDPSSNPDLASNTLSLLSYDLGQLGLPAATGGYTVANLQTYVDILNGHDPRIFFNGRGNNYWFDPTTGTGFSCDPLSSIGGFYGWSPTAGYTTAWERFGQNPDGTPSWYHGGGWTPASGNATCPIIATSTGGGGGTGGGGTGGGGTGGGTTGSAISPSAQAAIQAFIGSLNARITQMQSQILALRTGATTSYVPQAPLDVAACRAAGAQAASGTIGSQNVADSFAQLCSALNANFSMGAGGTTAPPPNPSSCQAPFVANMGMGTTGASVALLQQKLQLEGFTIPQDEIASQSFGKGTFDAVSGFQLKYNDTILVPLGLTGPTGFFGNLSRAKMNALYPCTP